MKASSEKAATKTAQRRNPNVATAEERKLNFKGDLQWLEKRCGAERTVESDSDDEPDNYASVNRRDGRTGQAHDIFADVFRSSNFEIETLLRTAFDDPTIVIGAALSGCMRGWAPSDPFKVLELADRRTLQNVWFEAREAANTTDESDFEAFVRLF